MLSPCRDAHWLRQKTSVQLKVGLHDVRSNERTQVWLREFGRGLHEIRRIFDGLSGHLILSNLCESEPTRDHRV